MSDRRSRRRVHFACMIVIAFLYVVSVPWYRDSAAPLQLWLGLPDWVAVALLCYVGYLNSTVPVTVLFAVMTSPGTVSAIAVNV